MAPGTPGSDRISRRESITCPSNVKWENKWTAPIGLVSWGHYCLLVSQLFLILCDPTDCSPPGSSVHGISQERILEWVAISFSRGSSCTRDQTHISSLAGRFCTTEPQVKSHLRGHGCSFLRVIWYDREWNAPITQEVGSKRGKKRVRSRFKSRVKSRVKSRFFFFF